MKKLDKIKDLFNKLLDYIYKKKCYVCRSSRESVALCTRCYDELTHNSYTLNRAIDGVRVYSAGVYDKSLQKIIRGLKYHHKKELGFYIAKFMWEYFEELIPKEGLAVDFQVVPVPLHKAREKKRGYNHMEIVAEEFCKLSGYEPNFGLIKRVKNTKPQYKLSRTEKIENLRDAFRADETNIPKEPVLIIDDICTSGATMDSMIKELKRAGVKEIVCLSASSPIY